MLHGLAIQSAADPDALDPDEMVKLCLRIIGTYFVPTGTRLRAEKQPRRQTSGRENGRRSTAKEKTNGTLR
jgi:hypothetical protein